MSILSLRKYVWVIYLYAAYGLFSACKTPQYYAHAPSSVNNPFLQKRNDTRLTGNLLLGDGTNTPGVDVQGAYAITNNIAVAASFTKRFERDRYRDYDAGIFGSSDDSGTTRYTRNMTELAVGYFVPLNERKSVVVNVFGGAGVGKNVLSDTKRDASNNIVENDYNVPVRKFFVQPSINFIKAKVLSFGVAAKASWIHFGNANTNFTSQELLETGLAKYTNVTRFFFEPAFISQYRFKESGVALNANINFLAFPNNKNDSYVYETAKVRAITVSLGATLLLDKFFK